MIRQFLANSGSSSGANSDASTESPRARAISPSPDGNSSTPNGSSQAGNGSSNGKAGSTTNGGSQPGSATSSRTPSLVEDPPQSGQRAQVIKCFLKKKIVKTTNPFSIIYN